MFAEFKKFLMGGNVVDLAVAVVVGPPSGPWSPPSSHETLLLAEIRDLLKGPPRLIQSRSA